jgi:hypothetical protein
LEQCGGSIKNDSAVRGRPSRIIDFTGTRAVIIKRKKAEK